MVKYVVKVVSTAKATNPSFAGDVNIYYYGKAQCLLVSKTVMKIISPILILWQPIMAMIVSVMLERAIFIRPDLMKKSSGLVLLLLKRLLAKRRY